MTLTEQAAYLKGLAEGSGAQAGPDGKLWATLCNLLCDMANEIEDLQQSSMDVADTIDEIGEDLSYLEEIVCDLDVPEDLGEGFYGRGPGFRPHAPELDLDELEDEDEDADILPLFPADADDDEDGGELHYDGIIYDAICPVCGEEISFDEETLQAGSTKCPGCGELLEFDLSEDDE